MKRFTLSFLLLLCCAAVRSATPTETQRFLRGYRHSLCPYSLPAETNLAEIGKVAALGFDTVGISFVGPYCGGHIRFSTLDQAIALVKKRGARVVLHLSPRFLETEGISDRLDNGRVIPNVWNRSPNYAMLDIFDPAQRAKCCDWFRICAKRYGKDRRVAAFLLAWGYQSETGFYHGDFTTSAANLGSECAGYSNHALAAFNRWRAGQRLLPLAALPRPSLERQSDDYILFMRFRSEFVRNVFQREIVAAVKAQTRAPVGIYAYISVNAENYARNWTNSPNADFYRSAGSASSFDMSRTLINSGIGWEDSELHDGRWNFTAACMERDEARQIARGGVFHTMYTRLYAMEPQWEPGVFDKVAAFLKTQTLAQKIRRQPPTIALYQPTWGAAALPGRSQTNPFLPRSGYAHYIEKMVGLAESFGLPYQLITEADLTDMTRLRRFRHILVPMWDLIPRVVGERAASALASDPRVLGISLQEKPLTRSQFRDVLRTAGIPICLDFNSNSILASRTANLLYNWGETPIRVTVPEQHEPILLSPYVYRFVP